ncbi:uncharacterized protein LOC129295518 [Prosopis cineraria]|uniref:uncharacterized protein LOC129295518 n=1 Tax=Prosopis cineraria TaxID=364024 RepID=UPI00240ED096|nr:uncharacterized protein LOC129295518 [Prosopis cineraria]
MSLGGCGGVICDDKGRFIIGFTLDHTDSDSLNVEIWAILMGSKLAWDIGMCQVVIASDSLEAAELVKGGDISSHQDRLLIKEAHTCLQREWKVEILHAYHSTNKVVDFLAK